jgi:hypothetical protein
MTKDLNREVAIKVMGWEDIGYWADDYGHAYWINIEDTECSCEMWNPLEDLNQCFEVVEKLRNANKYLTMLRYDWLRTHKNSWEQVLEKIILMWTAQFTQSEPPHTSVDYSQVCYRSDGKTPNEAILKAALEAIKANGCTA